MKSESPVDPNPVNPIPVNPIQVNPIPVNPEKVPFFFENPSTGNGKSQPGLGQSQCDKCGWNFDNESFLQVRFFSTQICQFRESNPRF